LLVLSSLFFVFCNPPKRAGTGVPTQRPTTTRPTAPPSGTTPMDTIRWAPATQPKPPIGDAPAAGQPYPGQFYSLAILLPFLTDQAEADSRIVPEKSDLALQFYGGASLALKKLSEEEGLNLTVDVLDTRVNDADFQRLLSNPRLSKAQVIIGPVRSTHVSLMAERIKQSRQILVSPESPNMELTSQNPDFVQINPSLRTHCNAIARYVLQRNNPEAITLVSKHRESDRLPYFQQANRAGNKPFAELIVSDDLTSFDRIDLRPYLRSGRKAVFILPTWASQSFVMAFLQKLRSVKGSVDVEVYGMPQWQSFTSIEPEYFDELNVHISSAYYVDRNSAEARAFRQIFYDAYGTIPGEDAYKGYDVAMFTGRMLKRYGLSFPQQLAAAEPFTGMHTRFQFAKVYTTTEPGAVAGNNTDLLGRYDYLENIFVHILKYRNYQFVPVN